MECLNCDAEATHACKDCEEAFYCSKKCQVEDWNQHHRIEHAVHAEEIGKRMRRKRRRRRKGKRRKKVVYRRRRKKKKKVKK